MQWATYAKNKTARGSLTPRSSGTRFRVRNRNMIKRLPQNRKQFICDASTGNMMGSTNKLTQTHRQAYEIVSPPYFGPTSPEALGPPNIGLPTSSSTHLLVPCERNRIRWATVCLGEALTCPAPLLVQLPVSTIRILFHAHTKRRPGWPPSVVV